MSMFMKIMQTIALLIFIHAMTAAQDTNPYLSAVAAMDKGNLTLAIEEFSKALDQTSRETEILLKRATCHYLREDYRDAICDLKRAEKSNRYPGSYLFAKSYAAMGKVDSAIYYLELHLQSPDKYPESYIKLDPAFIELENTRAWIEFWKQDWYSEFDILLAELNYLIKSKDYQDALNLADQSMETYGHRHELHGARARIFLMLGSNKSAISAYSEAISKSSAGISDYYKQRALAYRNTGNLEDAVADLSRAIKVEKDNFNLIMERSSLRNELGYYNEALRDISFYLQYFPEDHAAMFHKGNIYQNQGNYLKALECYNKTLEMNSSKPEYFKARGNAYLSTKTYAYALRDYSMALDLDPRDHETYLFKGLARHYLKDPTGACSDWQKAADYGSPKAIEYLKKYCR
jgi:tetratricopeptide (TPR) repeat protein